MADDRPQPPLTLAPEQMRQLGYQAALLRRRTGWEVVAPTRLALVTFCYADGSRTPEELEVVNRRVADAMLVDELAAAV